MAGYRIKSGTDITGIEYNALLYCKTNIGGYFFDGFMKESIQSTLTITSNPVETGASITDHAYVNPTTITMKIKMSDVHESLVPEQFTGGWSRSITAYNILRNMQQQRIPVAVLCRVGLFENMLISSISVDDNANTVSGLDAEVTLQEIPIARVRRLRISSASQETISTEMGKIQALNVSSTENQSILYMLANGGN